MRYPIDINKFRISQGFGGHPDIYKRFGMKGHNGIDIAMPNGTPIYAPHDGKILEKTNNINGYGNYVKIQNDKEGSVLAHNQKFVVKLNQEVKEGELIGYSNNSGFSTGPHLHWGYYKLPRNRSNGYLGYIDQSSLVEDSSVDPLTECLKQHTKLVDELTTVKKSHEGTKGEVTKQRERAEGAESREAGLIIEVKELKKLLASKDDECQERVNILESNITRLNDSLKSANDAIGDLSASIEDKVIEVEQEKKAHTKTKKKLAELEAGKIPSNWFRRLLWVWF